MPYRVKQEWVECDTVDEAIAVQELVLANRLRAANSNVTAFLASVKGRSHEMLIILACNPDLGNAALASQLNVPVGRIPSFLRTIARQAKKHGLGTVVDRVDDGAFRAVWRIVHAGVAVNTLGTTAASSLESPSCLG